MFFTHLERKRVLLSENLECGLQSLWSIIRSNHLSQVILEPIPNTFMLSISIFMHFFRVLGLFPKGKKCNSGTALFPFKNCGSLPKPHISLNESAVPLLCPKGENEVTQFYLKLFKFKPKQRFLRI